MYKNLVSCILPTYNRPLFLEESLTALETQSYQNIEVIVVNDGGAPLVLTTKLSNITVVNLERNSGSVTIPRNIGISRAKGEFIAHIDDDVISLPNKLELLVSNIKTNLLCYGNRIDITDAGLIQYMPPVYSWNPSLPQGWGVDGGQFIYRASFYDDNPYVFARRACDWELARRIWASNPNSFKHVNDYVCAYRWHANNRSKDETTKVKKIFPIEFQKYFSYSRWNHILPNEC